MAIQNSTTTLEHDQKIARMKFASVYPHYIKKVERKGRTQEELELVIHWLTGFSKNDIELHIQSGSTFLDFFEKAHLHPNASMITGVICGYRVEDIQNPLTQKVRYLDKIIDELAKGKSVEKICR
jgi:hypothetical protein